MGPRYVPLAVIVAISLVPHLIVAQISEFIRSKSVLECGHCTVRGNVYYRVSTKQEARHQLLQKQKIM